MDAATKLRRQFRKRAQDPTAYTIQKGGLWHYNRRVPAEVRAVDPELPEVIRRATGTDRLKEAQAIIREWAAADEERWLAKLEGREPSPWLVGLDDPAERERVLDKAEAAIEARAEKLRVADALSRSKSLATIPEVLRKDPQARKALEVVYAGKGEPMTWVKAWEAFEGRSHLSVSTREAYASAMRQLDGDKLRGPVDISRDEARQWLRQKAQAVTPSTVNVYVAAASAVLVDLFPDDEARGTLFRRHKLRFAKKPQSRQVLSRDDIRAMIAEGGLTEAVGLLMRISLGTGARQREVYLGEYDLERRTLTVTPEIAKTPASARVIPFSERLVPVVTRWLALRSAKKSPSLQALGKAFAKARDAAHLPVSKTLHSCRHSFLTELALKGVPEDRRKALGGHSNSGNVHAGYVHWGFEDLRADAELVDFESGIDWP